MRCHVSVLVPALLLATRALALDITAPDAAVPAGDTGVVLADLTCAPPRVGVHLGTGATLNLNGHVLDGCGVEASGVDQAKPTRATVAGPGEIRNAPSAIVIRAGTLRVRDVTVVDAAGVGILGSPDFADGPSIAKLSGVTITGSSEQGVRATKVKAQDVTATGNGATGIVGFGGVAAKRLVVTNNGAEGVFTAAGKLALTDSQVTGNAQGGVIGFAVTLARSTVTGNDAILPDVVSSRPPHLRMSTCGTSLKADATGSWGVCTND